MTSKKLDVDESLLVGHNRPTYAIVQLDMLTLDQDRFRMPLQTIASEFQANTFETGDQTFSAVTELSDGSFIVTWHNEDRISGAKAGIFARKFDSTGNAAGEEFQINAAQDGSSFFSRTLALSNGGYVATWTAADEGSNGPNVYGKIFDADDRPTSQIFQINTTNYGYNSFSEIALLGDGNFVVVWETYSRTFSRYQVNGQIFEPDGSPVGGEFEIDRFTAPNQGNPSVTSLMNGGFAVAWKTIDSDRNVYEIVAQVYDVSGAARGPRIYVSEDYEGNQAGATISGLQTGGFNISWLSTPTGSNTSQLNARHFDQFGNATSEEFSLNNNVGFFQPWAVTALADDSLALVQRSYDLDQGSYNIVAQTFDADGNPDQSTFTLNSYLADSQDNPYITATRDGGFIASWDSREQDGSGLGIFGKKVSLGTVSSNAPTDIDLSDQTITSDYLGGQTVGELTATDPDTGDTFTFTLSQPNANFYIDGSRLKVSDTAADNGALVAGTSQVVEITVEDSGGETRTEEFSIEIGEPEPFVMDYEFEYSKILFEAFKDTFLAFNPALATMAFTVENARSFVEATKSLLSDLYDQNIKYLLTFEGGAGIPLIGGNASYSIDLADLFGISVEGEGGYGGNEAGKVTAYISTDVSFINAKVASGKVGISLVPVSFTEQQADPISGFGIDLVKFNYDLSKLLDNELIDDLIGRSNGASSAFVEFSEFAKLKGSVSFLDLDRDGLDILKERGELELTAVEGTWGSLKGGVTVSVDVENFASFRDGEGPLTPKYEGALSFSTPIDQKLPFSGHLIRLSVDAPAYEIPKDELWRLLAPADPTKLATSMTDGRTGGVQSDWIEGTAETDYIEGGDSTDFLYGLGGDDYIWGGNHFDFIVGGTGNDKISGGRDGALASGEGGNDEYYVFLGRDDNDGADRLRILDNGTTADDDTLAVLMAERFWGLAPTLRPESIEYNISQQGAHLNIDFYLSPSTTTLAWKNFRGEDYFESKIRLGSVTVFNQAFANEQIETLEIAVAGSDASEGRQVFKRIDLVAEASQKGFFGDITEADRVTYSQLETQYLESAGRTDLTLQRDAEIAGRLVGIGSSTVVQASTESQTISIDTERLVEVIGTAGALNGDTVIGFGPKSSLFFDGEQFTSDRVQITEGSAILDIDVDGDGTFDTQVRLAGEFELDSFDVVQTDDGTRIVYTPKIKYDLAITPNHVSGIGLVPGQEGSWVFDVVNVGSSSFEGNVTYQFFLSLDKVASDDDVMLSEFTIYEELTGSNTPLIRKSFSFMTPEGTPTGNYFLGYRILVEDANLENNVFWNGWNGNDSYGAPFPERVTVYEAEPYEKGVNDYSPFTTSQVDMVLGANGDAVIGNDIGFRFFGGPGDDSIEARGGDDVIVTGGGADFVDGGSGSDILHLHGLSFFTPGYFAFNVSSNTQVGTQQRIALDGRVQIEAVVDGGLDADIVQLSDDSDAFFLHDAYSGFHHSVSLTEDYIGNKSTARDLPPETSLTLM